MTATHKLTGTLTAFVLLASLCPRVSAGELRATVSDSDGTPLADAVVVLSSPAAPGPAGSATAIIDQVDRQFVPFVTPVRVGTTISFPNNDSVRHHVYSFSPAKTFELPLYSGTAGTEVLFDRPGVVALGCNIHDWMLAYVYVTGSDWFARTDAGGHALIDAPPGTYRAHVWYPRLAGDPLSTQREVVVTASGTVQAVWQLALRSAIGSDGVRKRE